MIPQGTRLVGAYENGVRYGDHRILLVWNRRILSNVWSIHLRQMNASDPTGAAGVTDTADNHVGNLAGAGRRALRRSSARGVKRSTVA
jgi:type IV secretory pathway VirB10-like protein